MSIKPQAIDAASPALWSGGVLEVEGRDAGAFLQAQLMNDVRPLAVGDWQWSGWLNAKGRVIALAALLRHAKQRFWLLLPDYPAAHLAEELRRYVFRSKLVLAAQENLVLRGVWEDDASRMGDSQPASLFLGGKRARRLLISSGQDSLVGAIDPTTWAMEDLAHGLPRLPPAAVAAHTPQMLGLERLRAYSVKKGCYPGQEIVARTHFLGKAKRGLQRLAAPRPLAAGTTLFAGTTPTGDVLCSASDGQRHEALAVLPLDAVGELNSGADGDALMVIDFAEGLAR